MYLSYFEGGFKVSVGRLCLGARYYESFITLRCGALNLRGSLINLTLVILVNLTGFCPLTVKGLLSKKSAFLQNRNLQKC